MMINTGQNIPFSVIIVAAGSGSRMNSDLPKQFLLINGKTILRHTLEKFTTHPSLQSVTVVINPEHQELYEKSIQGLEQKIQPPIYGGATRQESVRNALQSMTLDKNDIVLIHDAARPALHPDDLNRILETMKTQEAVTLTGLIKDTLRKTHNEILGDTIDRDTTLGMQTPQAFKFELIKTAHEQLKNKAVTDDTALATEAGHAVKAVIAQHPNPKVTTRDDLDYVTFLLNKDQRTMMIPKTALGYDVHAFGGEAQTIRIGGIDIPHTHKLAGHSDADVVLHAITDAIYGLLADSDIGSHFPPSDPAHKGKDSTIFLKEALSDLIKAKGIIHHVDSTIICEAPKIGPHRETMRQKIAEIMNLPPSRISIKATTTEGLGFTGRREGIAAQSLITASFPNEE